MNDTNDLLDRAAAWAAAGEEVAIATVVQTWGSSPRPPGSRLILTRSGRMEGSVSGGCIEGAVAKAAREVLDGAPPRTLEFGVSDEEAWAVGLACGGRVTVFVERLS